MSKFKQVEAWPAHEMWLRVLGMDVLERGHCYAKRANVYASSRKAKYHDRRKEEPLTEEQNDYMATTLMLTQTPLKWTVIEAFLMVLWHNCFGKAPTECWLTDGKTSKIRYYDAFSEKGGHADQSEVLGLWSSYQKKQPLLITQNALEEADERTVMCRAQSDFLLC